MSFRDFNAPLEDPEGDRVEAQERADRAAEKSDPSPPRVELEEEPDVR